MTAYKAVENQVEKKATAKKAQEENKSAAKKAQEEKVKVTNITVCRHQYQEHYHNGPKEMPIVVPMSDAMTANVGYY